MCRYRRRPKFPIRAWQTPSILNDMARRIITGDSKNHGLPLPEECFTFLHLIEQLDKPGNAPNVFDGQQWKVLCKMRHVKLEMELRLRSLGGQVAEAESAVNGFVREINVKKSNAAVLEYRIAEVTKERVSRLRSERWLPFVLSLYQNILYSWIIFTIGVFRSA